jgi:hypothetical protein
MFFLIINFQTMFLTLPTSLIPDVLPATERRQPAMEIEHAMDTPDVDDDEVPDRTIPEETTTDIVIKEPVTQSDMEHRLTLRQLRDMCNELNISSTGKKADLVSRIIEERERSNVV